MLARNLNRCGTERISGKYTGKGGLFWNFNQHKIKAVFIANAAGKRRQLYPWYVCLNPGIKFYSCHKCRRGAPALPRLGASKSYQPDTLAKHFYRLQIVAQIKKFFRNKACTSFQIRTGKGIVGVLPDAWLQRMGYEKVSDPHTPDQLSDDAYLTAATEMARLRAARSPASAAAHGGRRRARGG